MIMEQPNVRKKVRKPLNVTKELSHMMLKLHNIRIKQSNMKKKKKRTIRTYVFLML